MERDPEGVLDELLVVSARSGSHAAFRELVERWGPRLHRHACRLTGDPERARDVVQEAWLNIARTLRRLDDPRRFSGWAFAIVSRRCVDAVRRSARERRLAAAATNEAAIAVATRAGAAEAARIDLATAIARLPIDQRLMVSLHYGEGLGVEEIAFAHGLPSGTVKSRLYAARQTLKKVFEGADDEQN